MSNKDKILVTRLLERKDKIEKKIKLLLGRIHDIDSVIKLVLEREIKKGINKNK